MYTHIHIHVCKYTYIIYTHTISIHICIHYIYIHTYTYTYITGQVKPSITEEAALEISKKARVLVFGNLPEDKTLQDGT